MNEYQKFVFVRKEDGSICNVSYKEVKKHEMEIIEDNIFHALKHGEYSTKEVNDYEVRAYEELKLLKQEIKDNHNIILKLDRTTERYIPEN